TARDASPLPAPPPAAPRPVDPLAAHVLERMPSLTVDEASVLAGTVRLESQEAGLDPVLVLAVIGVESGWEATAVSERGARGLMQLRSGALRWAERDGGLAPGDVHDPVHNVRVGIRYLARMVEHFDDLDLALIAYNAGPTRLASYLQAVGEVPESMWGYVRKVHREERRIRRGLLNPQVLVADAAR
ncbi:MAG TPA: lytic transglycosylase domain-containing protein, partial [Anaeromyxobacteraceae bacterium]|nr:lytic transglycosylase domain-containing protein [Anaeromyxobacteraceae bacterium]